MLDMLQTDRNTDILGEYIKLEENIYREKGLITYFGNEFMLDIFTDTAERTPTFMLPPFKKYDDTVSPPSWAFVKNPLLPTKTAWINLFGRTPRCLEWDSKMYRQMGAAEIIVSDPPLLDTSQILKFHIGNEEDNSRLSRTPNIAVNVIGSREIESSSYNEYKTAFDQNTTKFLRKSSLIIGNSNEVADYRISCSPVSSVLNLMEHMAVKLVLNTISTGTMVLMGRVTGNWMSWVEVSNKKLRDRGIRLISEICSLSYRDACYSLHETLEELKTINQANIEKFSPVQYTIRKIRDKGKLKK
jgi:N-acetylmuramic acid 6-phosphate etherase